MKASHAIATRSYICVLTNKKAKVLNSRDCFTLIQIFFKPLSTQSSSFYCGHAHGPSPQPAAGRSPTRVQSNNHNIYFGPKYDSYFFHPCFGISICQSYKAYTLVNYDSRVASISNLLVFITLEL